MERETSKTFRETGGRWTVASYLEYELRFTKERYPHLRCLLNLYFSRSCSLFSLEKRRRGGGRRDRLHDKHTHTHTRARYSVSLCFFSPPPLLFFPSSFFFTNQEKGKRIPSYHFLDRTRIFPEYSIRKQITTRNNLERNDTSTRVRNSSSRSIRGGTTEGEMHVDCWLTFLEFLSSPLLSSSPKTCVTCPRPRDDGLRRYERVQDSRLVDLEISWIKSLLFHS